MIKIFIAVMLAVVVSSYANPMPDNGKWGVDLKKEDGKPVTGVVYGEQKWDTERAALEVAANHKREFGGLQRHQTNVGVSGNLDVYKSNDGRTTGTVFGGANQQWNSHGLNSRGYEYGGRLEHNWRG